jgi:predicted esterase
MSTAASVHVIEPTVKHQASVIFLHGIGGSSQSGKYLLSHILNSKDFKHVRFVFPSAPTIRITYFNRVATAWYDIKGISWRNMEDNEGILKSSKLVHDLVDKEISSGIPSERIFVSGVSQGGAIALHSALTYNKPLGGVMACSSYMPLATSMLWWGTMKQPRSTRFLMTHGEQDTTVPFFFGKLSANYLKYLLWRNVTFLSYPDLDHYSTNKQLWDDVHKFMREALIDNATE